WVFPLGGTVSVDFSPTALRDFRDSRQRDGAFNAGSSAGFAGAIGILGEVSEGAVEAPSEETYGRTRVMTVSGCGLPHCETRPSSADRRLPPFFALRRSVSAQCSWTRPHGSAQ